MAISKCPNPACGNTFFQLSEANVSGANFKMYFVQCSRCGTVVCAMPYYDPGIIANDNNVLLKDLQSQVSNLQLRLMNIESVVQGLTR